MSKLPNAPLLEVIFELSWSVNTSKEQEKFQFLIGDMYSKLKTEYPKRVSLIQSPLVGFEIPLEVLVNKPIFRFIKDNSYPLYQLGPGLLSVNTIDADYFWDDFENEVLKIVEVFSSSYEFEPNTDLNISLKYLDFYKFDFTNDAYSFLKDNLHLEINHRIQPIESNSPLFFSFGTGYKTKNGLFNVIINRGGIENKGDGFIVETNLGHKINSTDLNNLSAWLKQAHSFLSQSFKTMTEGKMYDSFN